jgi:hypothetical protein
MRAALVLIAGAGAFRLAAAQAPAKTEFQRTLETALHHDGAAQPGGVVRFGFARSDLAVTLAGVALKPALALGSWAAFKQTGNGQAILAGDLVLTDPELNGVMAALQRGGVEPTAVHNHLLNESPHVVYMHVAARGDASKLARTLYEGLAASHTPMGAAPSQSAAAVAVNTLDTAAVAHALGAAGKLNGTVFQFSIPRSERITMMGEELPPSMGVATGINFQPTSGRNAAIAGDFVLRQSEVTPVMRTLRDRGIEVTAVHSHMVDEEPRLIFMHFWANADAVKLASGLRAALDQTASKR